MVDAGTFDTPPAAAVALSYIAHGCLHAGIKAQVWAAAGALVPFPDAGLAVQVREFDCQSYVVVLH